MKLQLVRSIGMGVAWRNVLLIEEREKKCVYVCQ